MSQCDPDDPDEFPPVWLLVRPLRESDRHPGSKTARMRRAIKGLLRGYGVEVQRITRVGPDGKLAGEVLELAGDDGEGDPGQRTGPRRKLSEIIAERHARAEG